MLKVLHVLHQALPYHHSGYDIRSHNVLKTQCLLGLDARAITGPFCRSTHNRLTFDNVQYYHMSEFSKNAALFALKRLYSGRKIFNQFFDQCLKKILNIFKPDIIHAHTPWFTALPALKRAKLEGLPFIYEIRGLWEESEIVEGIIEFNSDAYRLYRENDNYIISNADHIVVISYGLYNEIISRTSVEKKITIIPNGVDINKFRPLPPDVDLINSLGLRDKIVIGYVSSLRRLEGINILLEIIPFIKDKVIVLIIGDGPEKYFLEKKSLELGIGDRVRFLGNISHDEITRYYSIIDIFVTPRINAKVCNLVTPLKPLEAMAMGVCVVASDVGGLREIIQDGKTGLLFNPDKPESLLRIINELILNKERRITIGRNASEFMRNEKSWDNICLKYLDIYSNFQKSSLTKTPQNPL